MTFRTSVEANIYREDVASATRGWVISQNAGWKTANSLFQADIYAAWFNTDDYNTRIYSSEKNMLYSFSVPSFYGEGIRLAAVIRYNITSNINISAKAGWAHYFDRELIGTGLEEIEGRDKIDLYAQLRWKF